jgi:uncharacterized protein with HEPN domain
MQHRLAKYLFDIQESVNSTEEYLGENKNFYEYSSNKQLRRSVERELEIIGEAINKLKKLDDTVKISLDKKIISLRNQISHSYDEIDDRTIRGIIINHLPILKIEIENLLNT